MGASAADVTVGEREGWTAVTLRGPGGRLEATLLPALGMVVASLRHDGEELLAQRAGVEAYAQRGSTFGLPLLYPWANRLAAFDYEVAGRHVALPREGIVHLDKDTGLPLHGLMPAGLEWQVAGSGGGQDGAWLEAELEFDVSEERRRVFPFPHRLAYRASVGERSLSVEVTVRPTGEDPVPVCFGFHPYLALPGSDRRSWELELPVRRRVVLDGHGIPTSEREELAPGLLSGPLGDRTFDDSFDQLDAGPAGRPCFAVADRRRRVSIEYGPGFEIAQVFAPEASPFIAFEPMTAPVNALRSGERLPFAPAGGAFAAAFTLTVT